MQDRYVSLDPTYAKKFQDVTDREIVFSRRYEESRGGPYASALGLMAGLTVGTSLYVRAQSKGFPGFLPLTKLNVKHYTVILGGAFLTQHIVSGWVA